MNTNAGSIDRTIRVLLGVGLVACAVTHSLGAWAWVGVVPFATGLVGYCPLYSLFGMKTCKTTGGR